MGITGAGKSTIVNYLVGCEMEKLNKAQHKLQGVLTDIIRVKPDSKIRESMKIGHSDSVSMTVLSEAYYSNDLDLHIVDCAGYHDTRGYEINISNNVNMKALVTNAKTIRAVLLISWLSIIGDRSTGLNAMLQMCYQIFGSKEKLLKFKESVLVSVTRVPTDIAFAEIQNKFLEDKSEEVKMLGERLIILDILGNGEVAGSSNRQACYDKIADLNEIRDPKNFFHIA